MKTCNKCKNSKEFSDYNIDRHRKDGLAKICRDCSKARSRRFYNENKETEYARVQKVKKEAHRKVREFVFNYLLEHPCVDCNETDPVILEFDHQRDKEIDISKAVANAWSVNNLLIEIEKCEVRCGNCHRKKTAREQGWYRDIIEGYVKA